VNKISSISFQEIKTMINQTMNLKPKGAAAQIHALKKMSK
jgi:hypothetical protein